MSQVGLNPRGMLADVSENRQTSLHGRTSTVELIYTGARRMCVQRGDKTLHDRDACHRAGKTLMCTFFNMPAHST